MAKSTRANTIKRNRANLRSKVFAPESEARTERLAAKLQEVASQPKQEEQQKESDMDTGASGAGTLSPGNSREQMLIVSTDGQNGNADTTNAQGSYPPGIPTHPHHCSNRYDSHGCRRDVVENQKQCAQGRTDPEAAEAESAPGCVPVELADSESGQEDQEVRLWISDGMGFEARQACNAYTRTPHHTVQDTKSILLSAGASFGNRGIAIEHGRQKFWINWFQDMVAMAIVLGRSPGRTLGISMVSTAQK